MMVHPASNTEFPTLPNRNGDQAKLYEQPDTDTEPDESAKGANVEELSKHRSPDKHKHDADNDTDHQVRVGTK